LHNHYVCGVSSGAADKNVCAVYTLVNADGFYAITTAGHRQLADAENAWTRLVGAVARG
jgi:hypothetical protein